MGYTHTEWQPVLPHQVAILHTCASLFFGKEAFTFSITVFSIKFAETELSFWVLTNIVFRILVGLNCGATCAWKRGSQLLQFQRRSMELMLGPTPLAPHNMEFLGPVWTEIFVPLSMYFVLAFCSDGNAKWLSYRGPSYTCSTTQPCC